MLCELLAIPVGTKPTGVFARRTKSGLMCWFTRLRRSGTYVFLFVTVSFSFDFHFHVGILSLLLIGSIGLCRLVDCSRCQHASLSSFISRSRVAQRAFFGGCGTVREVQWSQNLDPFSLNPKVNNNHHSTDITLFQRH